MKPYITKNFALWPLWQACHNGHVHMKWDNGRSLSLIPGEDSFRKIKQELSQGQQMGGMKL